MNSITATLTFHDITDSISWTLSLTSGENIASIKGTVNGSTDHTLMFNNQEAIVSFYKTCDRIHWTLRVNKKCEKGYIMLPVLNEESVETWSSWVSNN